MIVLLGGCGGDGDGKRSSTRAERGAAESEEHGEEKGALERIPLTDRVTYYQLAVGSGLVRRRAAEVAAARPGAQRHEDPVLTATRARLRRLRPHDVRLAGLRARLRSAVNRLLGFSGGHDKGASVRSVLRATDAVNRGLRTYARRHPAVGALVPE